MWRSRGATSTRESPESETPLTFPSSALQTGTKITSVRCARRHRIVLAASSAYMKSAFSLGLAETTSARVALEDLGASTFEALLAWCYDGEVAIDG